MLLELLHTWELAKLLSSGTVFSLQLLKASEELDDSRPLDLYACDMDIDGWVVRIQVRTSTS